MDWLDAPRAKAALTSCVQYVGVIASFGLVGQGCIIQEHPDWAGQSDAASGSESADAEETGSADGEEASTGSETGTGSGDAEGSTTGMDADATDGSTTDADTSSGTDGNTTETGGGDEHLVFVTSTIRPAAFGGNDQADTECQALADQANLQGSFRAILSTTQTDASATLQITAAIRNTNGEIVANDADDFWDGSLLQAIGYDEDGAFINASAWTGTTPAGTYSTKSCGDWTETSGTGTRGATASASSLWIEQNTTGCNNSLHLYCISQ